jgi:hypothetical protein
MRNIILLKNAVLFLIGIYTILLGTGALPLSKRKSDRMAEWKRKYGKWAAACGAIVACAAAVGMLNVLQSASPAPNATSKPTGHSWRLVDMSSYGFVVQFPAEPTATRSPAGEEGQVLRLVARLTNQMEFTIARLAQVPQTEAEFFASATNGKVFSSAKVIQFNGRTAVDSIGDKPGRYAFSRQYYVSNTIYWALVEGPGRPDDSARQLAQMFINSLFVQ